MRAPCGYLWVAALVAVLLGSSRVGQASSQPRGDFAPGGSAEDLLQHPDVQQELKLSSQRLQTISQIQRAVHEKHKEDFDRLRDLGPEERRRKQTVLAKSISQEVMTALSEVLGPEQLKRLEQIHVQRQGLRAFSDPKVDKALRLTDSQKQNIRKIEQGAAQEARLLFRVAAQEGFQETLKKIERVRRKAVEKCLALLTDEQKKAWHELIGEPFEVRSQRSLIRELERGPDPSSSKP
jgi:hypothetical protein